MHLNHRNLCWLPEPTQKLAFGCSRSSLHGEAAGLLCLAGPGTVRSKRGVSGPQREACQPPLREAGWATCWRAAVEHLLCAGCCARRALVSWESVSPSDLPEAGPVGCPTDVGGLAQVLVPSDENPLKVVETEKGVCSCRDWAAWGQAPFSAVLGLRTQTRDPPLTRTWLLATWRHRWLRSSDGAGAYNRFRGILLHLSLPREQSSDCPRWDNSLSPGQGARPGLTRSGVHNSSRRDSEAHRT